MGIGRKIIKTLIVVLEGCVVKLKELEANLDGENEGNNPSIIPVDDASRHHDDSKKFTNENYYNISYLDQYVQSIGLPLGSGFMKIIQRTELKTEYNLIEAMLSSLSDNVNTFEAMYYSIKELKFVVFQYIQPSPLRNDEHKVVDKNFVCEELKEDCLLYDEEKSLYDNSLRVIESKQKLVMKDIVERFDSTIDKILNSTEDTQKEKMIQLLNKELNNRKNILKMRLDR